VREPLEPRRFDGFVAGLPVSFPEWRKWHEGQGCREVFLATGKGKPLKAEAQGRYPHETRREGLWVEQGVKRLRKPAGAAQSGEVSPMLVATCFLKRRRVREPHGRPFVVAHVVRDRAMLWTTRSGEL
jgi:hypothetical protein